MQISPVTFPYIFRGLFELNQVIYLIILAIANTVSFLSVLENHTLEFIWKKYTGA